MINERCFNHGTREAAARCPRCRRYFCRECVTEHEERVLCSACLKAMLHPGLTERRSGAAMTGLAQCIAGFLLAWGFFYLFGRVLLSLPTTFHEGPHWSVAKVERK